MFYAASAALISRGIVRSKHSGIVAAFAHSLVKPGFFTKRHQRALQAAFRDRSAADYLGIFPAPEAFCSFLYSVVSVTSAASPQDCYRIIGTRIVWRDGEHAGFLNPVDSSPFFASPQRDCNLNAYPVFPSIRIKKHAFPISVIILPPLVQDCGSCFRTVWKDPGKRT